MYIQHVCEAAERYMQHMYINENYLQITHSNIHVRINYSHGKNLISQYNVDIHKANTKNPIKDFVREKHKIKKTKPKKPKNKCIIQKKKKKICSQKIHENFVDQ